MAQLNFRNGTPVKTLELVYGMLEYYKPEDNNDYFLFVNEAQPDHPLRLFPSAMKKLVENLPKAIEQAKLVDKTDVDNDTRYDICQVAQHGMTKVRLYVNMYKTRAIVWLRLFSGKPNGPILPTKCGIRFHIDENVDAIVEFANCQ